MSKTLTPNDSTNHTEKTFYIFIIFTKNKDSDISFKFSTNETKQIHFSKENINGGFRYISILKHKIVPEYPSQTVDLIFFNKGENFKVSFDINEGTFIFNPILKIKKNQTASEKNIPQKNAMKVIDKIDIMSKCLEEIKDNAKLRTLYSDSADYLSKNPDFESFIYLLVKLYTMIDNFKDVFKKLLDIFWDKTKNEEIDDILDKENNNCKKYLDMIKSISSNSEKVKATAENDLDKAKFYGFILLYFNTYDFNEFNVLANKLKEKKENEKFFFDILIHYNSTFSNEIKVNLEQYVDYLSGKDFKTLDMAGFAYFNQIEEFVSVVNIKREKLVKMKNFKTLKIPKQLKYILENPENFIKELDDILEFSIKQKKLMIFLSGNFWKKMTEVLDKPCADNIVYLFELREKFKKYINFVREQYKKDNLFYINAEDTEGNDELAIALDTLIRKNIEESKEITNDEIINQIATFDIYYIEDIYINRRELNFLDKINFDEEEIEWVNNFKSKNFEKIFKNEIENFIQKLVSKTNKMEDIGKIIDMINEDEIKNMDKIEYLIRALRKTSLDLMRNSDLEKEPKKRDDKLSSLTCLFKLIYKHTQNMEKIQELFNKLDYEDKHKVLIKLIKFFPDNKQLKTYIFDFYINNINNYYKKIIELLEILDENNIQDFMREITYPKDDKKKYSRIISYDNFFTEKESLNLSLLQELNKRIDLIKSTNYFGENKKVLKKIYENIEKKKLEIKNLKSLLSFKEENVIKRFELLNSFKMSINPKNKYDELKKKYEKAKKEINELQVILKGLKVFHKEYYKNEIKQIEDKIAKFENGELKDFDDISKLNLELGEDVKKKVEKINKLNQCSIFKNLFENTQGKNQEERFQKALANLEDAYKKEKKLIKKLDNKTKKDIQIIFEVLGLKEDEQTQKDFKYIEDSSGAEDDIKNIIFFCENFKLNSNDNEEKEEKFNELLLTIYENIKNNTSKKENLNKLKEMGVYDCEKKGISVEFFNLFNNQKEAIDFLLTKSQDNLEVIKDKIISIDNAVKANDIDEVNSCLDFFNNVLRNCRDKLELFEKIGKIPQNLLECFKKFIKIFPILVEIDNNSDNTYNLYTQAKKYFTRATYGISLNCEEFIYVENNEEKIKGLDKIKSIKHKINIPNEVEIKLKENKELREKQDKTWILITFKEVVSNIELIEQFISVFRKKGCSLPIEIQIIIKNNEIEYFLDKKKISFGELSGYLLNVKNYLEKALDSNYKTEENLRFLYGEQFYTLNENIFGKSTIPSFLRYFLNNLNDKIKIKEGDKSYERSTTNYVSEYKDYCDDSFKIYNDYISSVIEKNEKGIEELYSKMKIKYESKDAKKYKGIYLYKSEQNSMEEDILKIFIEKTKNIPIAQNILISSKETSFEEIQAFFHRAFLCRFNTLFAIEINDSLSDVQLKIMNSFISQLLKYQLDKYNSKIKNQKVEIKDTSKYIEPLIIFFYNVNKLNESFLNEINKFSPEEYPRKKDKDKDKDNNTYDTHSSKKFLLSETVDYKLNQILHKNTHIYSSEISGLGKTEKIKYEIKKKKKIYIYFPLGGKLSRDIIFTKLKEILEKVEDVTKTAIHLDLYETEDTSILNEFLFSFCFTKFYSNNKNILYIPVNVEIYIEIPNCFSNFIENYPILNYFEIDEIKFQNRDKLRLDEEKTKFFNWMIPEENIEGKLIQKEPEEYIISHITAMGAKSISYHQINIFIKLFMSQYKMDSNNRKLNFVDENKKDVTKECIEEFAACVKYFILGVYAKLLTKSLDEEDYNISKKDTFKSTENISSKSDEIDITNYESNIQLDNQETNQNEMTSDNESSKDEIFISNTNNKIITDLEEKIGNEENNCANKDYEELRKEYINKLSKLYKYDLKKEEYKTPIIFIIKNTNYYSKILLSDENLKKYKTDTQFLKIIKKILNLENPITEEKDTDLISLKSIIDNDNYVITTDNFRKMILILYRLMANIPVILMGETGCGKTGLIRKLYQLLNNGIDMKKDKNMVNIDSSISDKTLIDKMKDINKEARINKDKDFWVLFDEINTCNSLGLLNEIFINRSYGGIKLEDNIRLIGTCNPYRLKTEKEESCGLSHPYKNKNLAYDVNILPQSLMYFVFNFGFLSNDDEYKYIQSILLNHFRKKLDKELINIVTKIISKCHKYLRKLYGFSVVSLREIKRFLKLYDNLMKYYENKDELETRKNIIHVKTIKRNNERKDEGKINKVYDTIEKKNLNVIQSLILSIYLSYYIRLIGQRKRTNFEAKIQSDLNDLANYYSKKEQIRDKNYNADEKLENNEGEKIKNNEREKLNNDIIQTNVGNLLDIKWKPLLKIYNSFTNGNKQNFSIFFENECSYVIDKIDLDKGIAKNRILKENIFLQFITITANIPLIIIGKPGSSKSLSFQQLKKSMRGRYSKNEFFRKYPQLLTTYFQGSESTIGEDIDSLFENGKSNLEKYKNNIENKPISLLIFDEIGLSEFAKDNPLKVLHKNLEYDGVEDGLSFVGFSNWKLDSSKLNRVLYLYVPDLDTQIDDLKDTARCIAKSIREDNIDQVLLDIICKSYQVYQQMVKKIKEYVVFKELEIQEMKQVLNILSKEEIKKYFEKDKNEITFADFKNKRENIETKKKYSWKYGKFADLKKTNEYKILYSNNRSVNEEFHGNRDFYNYNKGVCNIKSLSKNMENNNDVDISMQIEKVIERNFGGVDINFDIDFDEDYNLDLNYADETKYKDKFKEIIKIYPNAKTKLKIPSVFLFKFIFNDELKKFDKNNIDKENDQDDNINLKLKKYKINEKENRLIRYDLIECIKGNIDDNDARFLLLEIEEGLKYLVYQYIMSQYKDKNIVYLEGSPFINDIKDKNGEYKIRKISEIQNYCNKEMVLILSNLNQIYPFLYDFFNRNFITKDDKKYGRICQGNFADQLTCIHDKFRIIIMIDKNDINKQESPFLNRFEKAIVKFEELLEEGEKASSKNILKELGTKEQIGKININYNISNLLINFDKTSIDRLYFFYSHQDIKPSDEEIKAKIFEKIARTLPQDIIINLEDNHPIKALYIKKNIFNLKDYLIQLNELDKDKKKIFKFSIIYTFTPIFGNIEGINDIPQLMVSEIKRENKLIEEINQKKLKNKGNNNYFIMNFYQEESNKINFIITTLKNNYSEENISFIFIVHIKRIMDKKNKQRIYSIPDIDEKVDQIFIDNLDGPDISLDNLADLGIKNILENQQLVKKDEEFKKALKSYYNIYTNNLNFIDDYSTKMINYFNENSKFSDIILKKAFDLIYKQESKNKTKEDNLKAFKKIKEEIFANSYITHNTIDIVSLIIKDIIIEKKLRETIKQIIEALESDNFLTTLLALNDKKINQSFETKENLCKMLEKYLDSVKIKDIQKKAEFKTQYLVPGFLSFYKNISNFISKNIYQDFFKNEKKIRDLLRGNITKIKRNFHTEESRLLDVMNNEIITDESGNYKYINAVIKKCPSDLLLNDYINYFLNKYNENIYSLEELIDIESEISTIKNDEEDEEEDIKEEEIDNFYVEIIKIILNLRYKTNSNIIIENEKNELSKCLIKMMWLESNKNYIFTIIQLFREVRNKIYGNRKDNLLLKQINQLIKSNKIKYITDENRNPEHTTEVNECYYIILGVLYLVITDFETIILYDINNKKEYVEAEGNQIKVKIEKYFECLQYIVKVSQPFNDMLYLFSNELYIIVNLNSIINLLKKQKDEYIDVKVVKKIANNLRDNIDIIRESKFGKTSELKNNLEVLINLISDNISNKDKEYYSLLRSILIQEIMKVKDKNYRLDIFKSYIINEKEILLNSNMILDLLLKGFIAIMKDKIIPSIEKFENRGDEILIIIENKIKDQKNEYLSLIFLYYFEKLFHIYLDNYFKSKLEKKSDKNDKNLLEKEPLTVFTKCLDLLSKIPTSKSKIKNISKLLYIAYIRVFIFKFEEYVRVNSEKLSDSKKIIDAINKINNPISFVVELFYYKVIYNKNNKNIDIFTSQKDLYKLDLLDNFKDLINSKTGNDTSDDEENESKEKEDDFNDLLNEKVHKLKNSKEEYPFKEYFYYSDYIDEKYLTSYINDENQKDYPVLEKYLELKNNGNILNDFYIFNKALNSLNEEYSSKITREQANETLDKQLIYKENKDLFTKFFDIYNKFLENIDSDCNDYDDNDDNDDNDNDKAKNNDKSNKKLNPELPLFKFFFVDENEFREKFQYIYRQFIYKHNEIVGKLLETKSKILDIHNQIKNKISIQNINKEEEIFITKNELLDNKVLFNYSYRKVILNDDYSQFNKFEINLPYIEEMMTDELLKNKKLISDELFEFKYKNEDLEFKDKDICTKFREKINEEDLSINDKLIIYQYFNENKSNINLHLRLLDDFAYLIDYSQEDLDKIGKPSQVKISDIIKGRECISKDFREIFEEVKDVKLGASLSDSNDKKNFTVNKLLNIYEYYQILCFNKVKEKLNQYQEEIIDEEQKNAINNYIKNDLKDDKEIKNALEIALRKFILCFLSKEKNMEYKIKQNKNNVKNYLNIEDLWNKSIYKKDEFYQIVKKLKDLGIKINNVIPFYDQCFKGIYKNYFDDVKEEIKSREEEKKKEKRRKKKMI